MDKIELIVNDVLVFSQGVGGQPVVVPPVVIPPVVVPPVSSTCGPGEVMGPTDVIWSDMSTEGLFPQNGSLVAAGPAGIAVQFTADAAKFPAGMEIQITDENDTGPKEVVISACPHNFTPVDGQAAGRNVGNVSRFKLYTVFAATGKPYDCLLENGRAYYINVKSSDGRPSVRLQLGVQSHP